MDKAIGLFRLSPLIYSIDNWVYGALGEALISWLDTLKMDDAVTERSDEFWESLRNSRRLRTDEFGIHVPESALEYVPEPHPESALDHLENELASAAIPKPESVLDISEKLLMHVDIRQIEDGGLAQMRTAVATMRESHDRVELTNAAYSLIEACDEFGEHFYKTLPDHLLGEWGGELYRHLLYCDDPKELVRLAKCYRVETPVQDLSIGSNVSVDEEKFSIQKGNRTPCFLGNTRQFRLLAHLVANPFHFYSFGELAVIAGGDEFDRDGIKVAKCRLCIRLRTSGYEDVAKMLVSQRDHYAFQPR